MKLNCLQTAVVMLTVIAIAAPVDGKVLKLRRMSASEVYRALKESGHEDAVPEGRLITSGIAAMKGFTLGLTKGITNALLFRLANNFSNLNNFTLGNFSNGGLTDGLGGIGVPVGLGGLDGLGGLGGLGNLGGLGGLNGLGGTGGLGNVGGLDGLGGLANSGGLTNNPTLNLVRTREICFTSRGASQQRRGRKQKFPTYFSDTDTGGFTGTTSEESPTVTYTRESPTSNSDTSPSAATTGSFPGTDEDSNEDTGDITDPGTSTTTEYSDNKRPITCVVLQS